jgi:hypothetical protein
MPQVLAVKDGWLLHKSKNKKAFRESAREEIDSIGCKT